jgi:hypothetical protein
MSTARILEGDCLDVLATLPERSVQTCITSPPYFGLRDYGTAAWTGGDPACDHMRTLVPRGLDDPGIRRSTLEGGKHTTTAQADWLPFRPLASIKSTRGRSEEVIWVSDPEPQRASQIAMDFTA